MPHAIDDAEKGEAITVKGERVRLLSHSHSSPFPFPAVGHIKMHNVSLFMALGASCVATTVKATNREAKTKREKERGREHYCAVLLLFPTAVT